MISLLFLVTMIQKISEVNFEALITAQQKKKEKNIVHGQTAKRNSWAGRDIVTYLKK